MKLSTRRYAKYQTKWINNRFIKSNVFFFFILNLKLYFILIIIIGANNHSPIIHKLDTVDLENWAQNIFDKAKSIFEDYLNNKMDLRNQISPSISTNHEVINEFNKCEICNKIFVDKSQWESHLNGNKHKKRKESLKRKEMYILAEQIQTIKKMKENSEIKNL
jgi:hypothetical protein